MRGLILSNDYPFLCINTGFVGRFCTGLPCDKRMLGKYAAVCHFHRDISCIFTFLIQFHCILDIFVCYNISMEIKDKGECVMCGICRFPGDTAEREQVLERMMRVIWYRGPDGSGVSFEAVG